MEAVKDLVGDNAGPLAELWNLDKGCWVVPLQRDTPDNDNAKIQSSYWREIRRNQKGIHERIQKERCFQKEDLFSTHCF